MFTELERIRNNKHMHRPCCCAAAQARICCGGTARLTLLVCLLSSRSPILVLSSSPTTHPVPVWLWDFAFPWPAPTGSAPTLSNPNTCERHSVFQRVIMRYTCVCCLPSYGPAAVPSSIFSSSPPTSSVARRQQRSTTPTIMKHIMHTMTIATVIEVVSRIVPRCVDFETAVDARLICVILRWCVLVVVIICNYGRRIGPQPRGVSSAQHDE